MDKRIGVIAIVVEDRRQAAEEINQILSEAGDIIRGRMGLPFQENDLSTIALIVEGTSDRVSAVTGKLGNVTGVSLKSALTSCTLQEDD